MRVNVMVTEPRMAHEAVCIYDLIGPDCITFEDGKKIYEIIHPELKQGSTVVLDFAGVEVLATPFANTAIGNLLEDMTLCQVQNGLSFVNLSSDFGPMIDLVIENASQYFSDPSIRDIVSQSLKECG